MKKVIIIAPHFPPSNLASVHRSRLFAQHLPAFGWEPIIVTVDSKYYEEQPDWKLQELLPEGLRIEKVRALSVKPVRFIGDIGIRGFYFLYKRIIELSHKEKIDFIYIPIPSHFAALLGRMLHRRTGIPYGIDYIDPWVHTWPGTEKLFSRHWFSMKLGSWLEPVAVKKASLITGVAPGYYAGVLERNKELRGHVVTESMPYGGEARDHQFIRNGNIHPYLFKKQGGIFNMVYAGALLPRAIAPLRQFLKAVAENRWEFQHVRFHFIGSGTSPGDATGHNVRKHAEEFGLWENIVYEYPRRIPYLDVLAHLDASDGVLILGSTEPHYTPSKVYQSVLCEKPVLAILHEQSSACSVIGQANAGITLGFDGEEGLERIGKDFMSCWRSFLAFSKEYNHQTIDKSAFEQYSAFNITRTLAHSMEKAIGHG